MATLAAHMRCYSMADRDCEVRTHKCCTTPVPERFTGADMVAVCMQAGLYALRENPEARAVTTEHFCRMVKQVCTPGTLKKGLQVIAISFIL